MDIYHKLRYSAQPNSQEPELIDEVEWRAEKRGIFIPLFILHAAPSEVSNGLFSTLLEAFKLPHSSLFSSFRAAPCRTKATGHAAHLWR
jgi:hypothetical protein